MSQSFEFTLNEGQHSRNLLQINMDLKLRELVTFAPLALALARMASRSSTEKATSLTPSPCIVRCFPISKVVSELGS